MQTPLSHGQVLYICASALASERNGEVNQTVGLFRRWTMSVWCLVSFCAEAFAPSFRLLGDIVRSRLLHRLFPSPPPPFVDNPFNGIP